MVEGNFKNDSNYMSSIQNEFEFACIQFPLGTISPVHRRPGSAHFIRFAVDNKKYTKFQKFTEFDKVDSQSWQYCRLLAMILLTMIARVADGLPLAASIQEDEQVSMKASFQQKLLKIFWYVMNVSWLGTTDGIVAQIYLV